MPKRATDKLTKRFTDSLGPREDADYTVWDRELPGFGVRVRESGSKSFLIKYRNTHGRQRKLTLGVYGPLTAETARRAAISELAKVTQGTDPAQERRAKRNARTVEELCDTYFTEAKAGRVLYRGRPKKQSTLDIDKGRIERHIKPLLGTKPIADLSRQEVERFMFSVRDGETRANVKTGPRGRARIRGGQGTAIKAVKLLSSMFSYAIKQGWVDANPCQGIEKPSDGRRERFLNAVKYARLGKALEEAANQGVNQVALDAIRFIAVTGCRKSEVLRLRGSEIDTRGRCLRFEDTKTGQQMRPCGNAALEEFVECAENSKDGWVFPSSKRSGPLSGIAKPIQILREFAGIPDFTLHTLRHSYATVAHEIGYSELTIAGLLGHAQGTVTSRYAHHVDHALADAADRVSRTISVRMTG